MTRTHRVHLMLALVGLSFLLLAATRTIGAPSAASSNSFGVYRGGGKAAEVPAFENWAGRKVFYVLDALAMDSWNSIAAPDWWLQQWKPTPYTLVLSVPMLPNDPAPTLAQGAAGNFNQHYRALAQKLVQHDMANRTIIRLGWEFNLSGSRWSAASNPSAWTAYWRQIVDTMRSVSPGLRFDWCPNEGRQAIAADRVYPGDAYVDYIGMDAYDTWWSSEAKNDVASRWNTLVTQPYGLNWHKSFAAQHGKPMSYPEWGLWVRPDGHGGGDNPYYIQKMSDWFNANNVAYQMYFELDAPDGAHRLMTGQFPNGASKYRQLFGSSD